MAGHFASCGLDSHHAICGNLHAIIFIRVNIQILKRKKRTLNRNSLDEEVQFYRTSINAACTPKFFFTIVVIQFGENLK